MGLGCRSDATVAPPAGLPYAVASRSCAPTDGPAVTIVLMAERVQSSAPAVPSLSLHVWHPLESLRGRTFSLVGASADGAATFHPRGTTFETATSAVVRVTEVAADSSIEGTVDATFPASGRIRGTFHGVWIAGMPMCG